MKNLKKDSDSKTAHTPTPIQWWGYKHQSGTIHLKRYFAPIDIDEAHESPFCQIVVGPFPASSHQEAQDKLKQAITRAEGGK